MKAEESIAFEGITLEDAYSKASSKFGCSITDLKSEIIQTPSNGFLGLFKKTAIIKVYKPKPKHQEKKKFSKSEIKIKDIADTFEESEQTPTIKPIKQPKKTEKIFDDFYAKDKNEDNSDIVIANDIIIKEIETKINELFQNLCYNIDDIKVSYYDANTVYIEFSGEDSALLIGKEGYRYKALSYILFNWIHDKYDLMVRLEVAQFLEQQEESIQKYLEPVIETIKLQGSYKTKALDGILVHIALKILREEFPDKYVAVKTNIKGERYILVNEYKK